jgi:hypothetical protein
VAAADLFKTAPTKPSYAVSFNFGIYLSSSYKHPLLAYKHSTVGELIDSRRVRLTAQHRQLAGLINRTLNQGITFDT